MAQEPPPRRDAARLLVVDRANDRLDHRRIEELPELLRPSDLLVFNRSRVFPARLLGRRRRGGAAEVLLVRRVDGDLWEALLRPGRRLRAEMVLDIAPGFTVRIEDDVGSPKPLLRRVRLFDEAMSVDEAIERHGHVPLPPYILRPDAPPDRDRYQTLFARESGSIAAPTAGLHFSAELLERLARRGIETRTLVLHVGPGTFRPVKSPDVRQHTVDPERFTLPEDTVAAIEAARGAGRRIVAVGTTVTRALETAADSGGRLSPGDHATALVIIPGYRFRIVDALLTNFHLPRSSLLLLASAFAGRARLLAAYQEAIRLRYRFYSYGDATLLL